MAKVFFMKIRNIVLLMDPQLQPPPSREFLAMHFLHSPQLSSLAMGCIHCWGGRWPTSPCPLRPGRSAGGGEEAEFPCREARALGRPGLQLWLAAPALSQDLVPNK